MTRQPVLASPRGPDAYEYTDVDRAAFIGVSGRYIPLFSTPIHVHMASRYIKLQHNRYWARFQVPRDVRDAFGKSEEWVNLHTDDRKLAEARAPRAASDFRARVLEARGRAGTVEADALMWRRQIENEPSEPGSVSVAPEAAVLLAADRYVRGGRKAVLRAADLYHEGNEVEALAAMGGPQARTFVDIAIRGLKPLRPFVDPWFARRCSEVEPKTAAMDRTSVERFIEAFPLTTKVTKVAVSDWAQRRKTDDNLSPTTVQREMSGIRSFWGYLKERGEVPDDGPDPFGGLRFKVRQKDTVRAKRVGFAAAEVAALFKAAREQGDEELADLIALAAFTGARREELCALKVEDVRDGWLRIADTKTEAGAREVPLHPRLKPLVARLTAQRRTGFLLVGLDENKYGKRGDAIGKRFTRLKTSLGHGETKAFHSIRHTVVHILESAGTPENHTADIVGHKKRTMTYGLYSGRGATRGLLADAISKVAYPRPLGR